MNGLLAVVWIVGSILALVAVIRPFAKIPGLRSRRSSVLTFISVFLAIPIVLACRAPSTADQSPKAGDTVVPGAEIEKSAVIKTPFVSEAPSPVLVATPPQTNVAEKQALVAVPTTRQLAEEAKRVAKEKEELERRERLADQVKEEQQYRFNPELALDFKSVNWARGGFGSVMLLSGVISNKAQMQIKDPFISCELVGDSGTVLHELKQTLYKSIRPRASLSFKQLNMGFVDGQAGSARCKIETATIN